MAAIHRACAGEGKYSLEAVVVQCEDGLSIYLGGGEKPHVGTVVLSQPRRSLTKDGSLSYTTSVLNILGHMDDSLARPMAEKLCSLLNCNVVVTAGVHIDNATPEEISKLLEMAKKLTDKILDIVN